MNMELCWLRLKLSLAAHHFQEVVHWGTARDTSWETLALSRYIKLIASISFFFFHRERVTFVIVDSTVSARQDFRHGWIAWNMKVKHLNELLISLNVSFNYANIILWWLPHPRDSTIRVSFMFIYCINLSINQFIFTRPSTPSEKCA